MTGVADPTEDDRTAPAAEHPADDPLTEGAVDPHAGDRPAPPAEAAEPAEAPPGDRADRVFPTSAPWLALQALSVAVIGWLWGITEYGFWHASPDLAYGARVGDGKQILMTVKSISENGWFLHQPRLGYPFGQTFYDFPMGGETWQLGIMKGITTFIKDPATAVNAYFFFGFGFLAVVTFLVLRHLRFNYGIALVASLAFTFLYYHFVRGEWHLWRSTYYSVPLAALVILWSQQWRARFLRDPLVRGRAAFARSNLRLPRVAAALALCVVIGGTETMATFFTMTFLGVGCLVAAIRYREPSRFVAGAVLAGTIGATFLVCSFPSLNYWHTYGQNPEAAQRGVAESESYGMKLWTLVTPPTDHRFNVLGRVGAPAQKDARANTEQGVNLNLLATAGFFGVLYGLFTGGMRKRSEGIDIRGPDDREVIRETASIVVLTSILFGVIGGLSVLVARFGFEQVRVWDRMSIFIALFSLLLVASWAERLDTWIRARSWPGPRSPALRYGLVVLLAVVALFDTINLQADYPRYRREWAVDQRFVDAIERKMPDGAAIFQLPVLPFPETTPPGKMADYDPLRGFLHDDGSLEWSYGAIKGRPDADWQTYLRDQVGPIGAMPALLGMGFTGLWVDTYGYTDGGAEVRQIARLVGTKPIRSDDGRFLFYDLRPYKRRLGLSDAELRKQAEQILKVTPPT